MFDFQSYKNTASLVLAKLSQPNESTLLLVRFIEYCLSKEHPINSVYTYIVILHYSIDRVFPLVFFLTGLSKFTTDRTNFVSSTSPIYKKVPLNMTDFIHV